MSILQYIKQHLEDLLSIILVSCTFVSKDVLNFVFVVDLALSTLIRAFATILLGLFSLVLIFRAMKCE